MQQIHPEMRKLNDQLRPIFKEIQTIGEEKGKLIEARRHLGSQKNENDLVKDELNKLESGAAVFKLIGPVLVPQDQSDAKTIVANRLEFINHEINKTDKSIAELDRKENELQKQAQELYRKMQEKQQALQQQQQQQHA